MSRILGINLTQDASVCLLVNGVPVCLSKERITREKHHWGQLRDLDLYLERIPEICNGIDLVVECYSSDSERKRMKEYHDHLHGRLGPVRIAQVPHHLSHASSTYYPSAFDSAAVMVIDAQGSPISEVETFPNKSNVDTDRTEVASFYFAKGTDITCIHKQTIPSWTTLEQVEPAGLGWFYLLMTQCIFPGEGNEGKVMGLAPYGNPDTFGRSLGLGDLEIDNANVYITEPWKRALTDSVSFLYKPRESDREAFQRAADFAAAGQRAFEQGLLQLAQWIQRETGEKNLCYTGGAALNCTGNGRILREGVFEKIFIAPAPHDGGTALGSALYGSVIIQKEPCCFHWVHDFLGPTHEIPDEDVLKTRISELNLSGHNLEIVRPENLAETVAQYLASGQVIALFDGKSEFGPRALGHRSILADPRAAETTDWINRMVKGRESFRPLAPLVLEHKLNKWFDVDRELPFMQFAVMVRSERRVQIPAVTHVDGSARAQSVSEKWTPLLHSILIAFELKTGVPVLINTSLNGQNEPLVETFDEAFNLFVNTPIEVLVAPPFILRLANSH